jgi:hypothetical protein
MKVSELFEDSKVRWVVPSARELKHEYEYEYLPPKRNWPRRAQTIGAHYPFFTDLEHFMAKVRSGTIVSLRPNEEMANLSRCQTLEELKDLVSTYTTSKDVDGLVKAFEQGKPMAYPIVIRGRRGRFLMSGNTRINIARILDLPVRIMEVNCTE